MGSSFKGYIAALGATIIWAGNFIVARMFAEALPPCQFNFWRWTIAFVAILPFALPRLHKELPAIGKNFGYLSLMAIVGVTLMNSFIYKAGQTVESLNMALLMPATPIVILLLSRVVYGERFTVKRLAGMCVAMAGILLLISRGDFQKLARLEIAGGDLWTLGCMLSFAVYSLLMRRRSPSITPAVFNAVVFFLGLVYALPLVFAELWLLPPPVFSLPLLGGIIYAGLGCSTAAFWLWTIGIDRIGPVRAGIVYYSLPLFAAIMANLALNEAVTSIQVYGGALIIGGIFVATVSSRSHQRVKG